MAHFFTAYATKKAVQRENVYLPALCSLHTVEIKVWGTKSVIKLDDIYSFVRRWTFPSKILLRRLPLFFLTSAV